MTDPRIWIDRPQQRETAPIKSCLRMLRLACAISEPTKAQDAPKKLHPLDDPKTPQWQKDLWIAAQPKGRK